MEEIKNKNEIIKEMMNVDYYPVIQNEVKIEKYTKLPITDIAALGVAFSPLVSSFLNAAKTGAGEQLFRLDMRGYAGELAKFKDGSGFLSAVVRKGEGVVGQAGFVPVSSSAAASSTLMCNPVTLFMAAALMNIDKKLDTIQETQQEIMEFLEEKEKSKIRGNLNVLADVMNNFKFNWENEKYKTNKHIQVQEIKRDAEHSILLYRDQIEKLMGKHSLIHSDQDVKSKLKKLQSKFEEYQLSVYMYSYATFLEVMLLENFDSSYLDSVKTQIEDYSVRYRELYTKCYEQIESYSKSTVQSFLASGLATASKATGGAISKVPIVSKSQIDEGLIEAGSRIEKAGYQKAGKTLEQFVSKQSSYVRPFVENIEAVNRLYNEPVEMLFDGNNIYLFDPQTA